MKNNIYEELADAVMEATDCYREEVERNIRALWIGYDKDETELVGDNLVSSYSQTWELKEYCTSSVFSDFIEATDVEYEPNTGVQTLFGVVWLSHSKWMSRVVVEDVEQWKLNSVPRIPDNLCWTY